MRHTGNCIGGSNPSLSANISTNPLNLQINYIRWGKQPTKCPSMRMRLGAALNWATAAWLLPQSTDDAQATHGTLAENGLTDCLVSEFTVYCLELWQSLLTPRAGDS